MSRRTWRRRARGIWVRGACAPARLSRTISTVLAVDVGNTNVVLGVYVDGSLRRTWRLATVHDRTEDELAVSLDAWPAQEELSLEELDAPAVGSVAPPLTAAFTRL